MDRCGCSGIRQKSAWPLGLAAGRRWLISWQRGSRAVGRSPPDCQYPFPPLPLSPFFQILFPLLEWEGYGYLSRAFTCTHHLVPREETGNIGGSYSGDGNCVPETWGLNNEMMEHSSHSLTLYLQMNSGDWGLFSVLSCHLSCFWR